MTRANAPPSIARTISGNSFQNALVIVFSASPRDREMCAILFSIDTSKQSYFSLSIAAAFQLKIPD
jgi:hypothetical protein